MINFLKDNPEIADALEKKIREQFGLEPTVSKNVGQEDNTKEKKEEKNSDGDNK